MEMAKLSRYCSWVMRKSCHAAAIMQRDIHTATASSVSRWEAGLEHMEARCGQTAAAVWFLTCTMPASRAKATLRTTNRAAEDDMQWRGEGSCEKGRAEAEIQNPPSGARLGVHTP